MKFNNLLIIIFLSFVIIFSGFSLEEKHYFNYSNKLILKSKKKLHLYKLWSFKIKKNKYFKSLNAIIKNSVIFTAYENGKVYALNSNDGKILWFKDLSNYINNIFPKTFTNLSGGLLNYNNRLYLGSLNSRLYCLNSYTGKIIWNSLVAGEVLSTPASNNKFVIVHTGNGMVQSLNKTDGIIQWTTNLDSSLLSLFGDCDPIISNNRIIVGDNEGNLNSICIETGKIIWKRKISFLKNFKNKLYLNSIKSKPILKNNIIYTIACKGNISALDEKSGKIIWSKNIGSFSKILINKYNLYIKNNNKIISLNLNNGKINWQKKFLCKRNITDIVIYKDYILFGDKKGYIYFINKFNGKLFYKNHIYNHKIKNILNNKNNQIIIQSEKGYISSFTI